MRYPNLRYGNPAELRHYAMPYSLKELSKMLRRSERTVKDWTAGKTKVPWWVPEVMRLKHAEAAERTRQMECYMVEKTRTTKLGIVMESSVIELRQPQARPEPKITDLRRDDFDAAPARAIG